MRSVDLLEVFMVSFLSSVGGVHTFLLFGHVHEVRSFVCSVDLVFTFLEVVYRALEFVGVVHGVHSFASDIYGVFVAEAAMSVLGYIDFLEDGCTHC